MSRLPILTPDTAPAAAQPRLQTALKANGFLPNLLGVLANAPEALEMYQEVGAINARTTLTPGEREVVQITAAVSNGCGFCVAGHTALTQKKKLLPDDVLHALRHTQAIDDTRLQQLASFTLAVLAHKGNVPDADWQGFLAAGYTQQQALEVVLGLALATLCNYANNLSRTPINAELQPYALPTDVAEPEPALA
ncbi:MAG: carboxymuconolactone decarboxylase family protein [Comamonas sp.]|nr:carboxymuconolactone decarboxylase family protein [Comamonas sp.]